MALCPISGYDDGDKFDDSIVSGASSCVAFAKYIYGKLWGSKTGSSISSGTKVTSLANGSWVKTKHSSGTHDMIVDQVSSSSVYVYDANWVNYGSGNPYTVSYRKYTITDFEKVFSITGGTKAP